MNPFTLTGRPTTRYVEVGSAGGGTINVTLIPATGEILVVNFITAFHNEAINARLIQWYMSGTGAAPDILLPGEATVLTGIRVPLPMGSFSEPLILSPGGLYLYARFTSMGAGVTCRIEVSIRVFTGCYPLAVP